MAAQTKSSGSPLTEPSGVPRAVEWESCANGTAGASGATDSAAPGTVVLLDQTLLPHKVEFLTITKTQDLIAAIQRLSVRGAPAIGVAGAFGVALAFLEHCGSGAAPEPLPLGFTQTVQELRQARPTAVNLARMVDRTAPKAVQGFQAVLTEALAIRDEELAASQAMGELGAELVKNLVGLTSPVSSATPAHSDIKAMTICNTGGLATVERGTALAVIQTLHEQARLQKAIACETRPLLQGARLTTWELAQMGAPYELIADSAGPAILAQGEADVVLVGADRIAANGDTANKIGTFSLALGARHAGVPFVVVAPESTVDNSIASGHDIEIEYRGDQEVREVQGQLVSVADAPTRNPAFDVTPAELITAIVTDRRVVRLDQGEILVQR